MVKTFSLDSLLAILRGTILHPLVSPSIPVGLVLFGLEPSPLILGSEWASTRWSGGMSGRLKGAVGCVAAAWILSINRIWTRKALNPSHKRKPDLKREVVVVTGGATGIGALLAQKLHHAGATVVVLDISTPNYALGRGISHVKCDVSDASSVRDAAATVNRLHGAPTILVANAGVVRGRNLLDATDDDLRLTFGVNVLGLLWCIRAFLPGLIAANSGHVLITSSVTSFLSVAHMSDYSASKAAVTSLIEGLQTELKHQHGNPAVAVSALYPATIRTKMFHDLHAPDSFILPVLEPEDVAQRMFDILASGQSEMAFMPAASNAQPWLRVLPTWMRVGVQDASSHMADGMGKST